jgi:uncharacterized membrane protein YhaH (DUF805 family)
VPNRITRGQWWTAQITALGLLALAAAGVGLGTFEGMGSRYNDAFAVVSIVLWVMSGILALAACYWAWWADVTRLHDLGVSGWWSLLRLIPLVDIVLWFVLALVAGSHLVNQYGDTIEGIGWMFRRRKA